MPSAFEGIDLYHPVQQQWHKVPNHPLVIQDFQDRGWETPEESAARAAEDANQLRGQELEEALDEAGLAKGGTVKAKQERLAAHRAERILTPEQTAELEQTITDPATQADTTDNTESEGSE